MKYSLKSTAFFFAAGALGMGAGAAALRASLVARALSPEWAGPVSWRLAAAVALAIIPAAGLWVRSRTDDSAAGVAASTSMAAGAWLAGAATAFFSPERGVAEGLAAWAWAMAWVAAWSAAVLSLAACADAAAGFFARWMRRTRRKRRTGGASASAREGLPPRRAGGPGTVLAALAMAAMLTNPFWTGAALAGFSGKPGREAARAVAAWTAPVPALSAALGGFHPELQAPMYSLWMGSEAPMPTRPWRLVSAYILAAGALFSLARAMEIKKK